MPTPAELRAIYRSVYRNACKRYGVPGFDTRTLSILYPQHYAAMRNVLAELAAQGETL